MNSLSKETATWHEIGEAAEGQRVDNFLVRLLKGVPKSHVYRLLRSGQVRVNSGRVGPDHRLKAGDKVRVPPIRTAQPQTAPAVGAMRNAPLDVLYEDDALLVINKPAGLAVHGGSGVSFGVIEQLRRERPAAPFMELVHRLDRDTSGVLLLAKKRSALVALHEQMRSGGAHKYYATLVRGNWVNTKQKVDLALHKYALPSGERRVRVSPEGMPSVTIFRLKSAKAGYSLLEAELKTGRTHQIRVHLAHLGYPIAGDDKYGDYEVNKALGRLGLKRMFLHAAKLVIRHPGTGEELAFEAPLPAELSSFLARLEAPLAATL
jgi:23S rRNA pseudouridine955/2504/2580 synthase